MRMAAYCRVSTEKDEQLSSLKNQKEFFEQYAEKTGDTLVKIYADEGISGKSMRRRTAFTQLLKDSENNTFDYVAVKDISRFARNTSDFLYGIRTLKSNGTDVRFLSGNQTVIGESEFVLTVFAALAQEESANLSKRVIFGKNQNAKKGRVPNLIYGYDKADTYTLKINEKESFAVRLIFKWYTEGCGIRRIADKLNEMNIPTKKSTKWISKTVRRILENPVYTGKLINHKSITKDFLSGTREELPKSEQYIHDRPELRIISDEEFAAAQKNLELRRSKYASSGERHSAKHIFSNLIKCGECGKGFTARTAKSGSVTYRCGTHNSHGNSHCSNSAAINENLLLNEIKKYLLSVTDSEIPIAAEVSQSPDSAYPKELLKTLERRKTKLREMYIADVISADELKKEIAAVQNGIASANAELECLHRPPVQNKSVSAETLIGKSEYTNGDMRSLIEKIVVYPDKSVEIFML